MAQNRIRAVARTLALLAAMAMLPSTDAGAQGNYPSKPIRFVVVVAAGGGADAVGRILAAHLYPKLGQPVVVENRIGAGGNIASEYVARSAPDGYTLLLTSNNHNVNPLIYQRPGYDARKDFVPIVELTQGPSVLITPPDSGFRSLKELIELARARPGTLSYGSSGIGLPTHIATEMLKQAANIDIIHVPYKGAGLSLQAVLGKQIPLVTASLSAAMPHIQAEKLRPLAMTGPARWPTLPDVPTIAESGYPTVISLVWLGILAPSGTPQPIVDRLNREIAAALSAPEIRDRITSLGAVPAGGSPADFDAMLKADYEANEKIVARIGLKVD
jgi:tripartite-type tricarboxylate transporter receptor subunit TctC